MYVLCEIYIIISNIQDYKSVIGQCSKSDDGRCPARCTAYIVCIVCVYKVQVSVRILSVCVESVSEQGHFRSSSRCTMIYGRIYRHYTRWVNEKVDKVH
jgi:hypothetical protein